MAHARQREALANVRMVGVFFLLSLVPSGCADESTGFALFDIVHHRDAFERPDLDVGATSDTAGTNEDGLVLPGDMVSADHDAPTSVSEVRDTNDRDSAIEPDGARDIGVASDMLDAGTVPPGPLTGTWARKEIHRSQSEAPIIGLIETDTHSLSLVRMQHRGDSAALTGEVCDIRIDTGSAMVNIIMPPAFIASIPFLSRDVSVPAADETGGFLFHEPRTVDVRGAIVEDPETSPLPEDAADPRVWDQDGDGNPGLSVRITGIVDGEIYVVQRAWAELTGTGTSEEIAGDVDWGQEQIILGTDNELLSYFTESGEPAGGTFVMLRAPEDADCDWMLAHEEELFGARSTVAD